MQEEDYLSLPTFGPCQQSEIVIDDPDRDTGTVIRRSPNESNEDFNGRGLTQRRKMLSMADYPQLTRRVDSSILGVFLLIHRGFLESDFAFQRRILDERNAFWADWGPPEGETNAEAESTQARQATNGHAQERRNKAGG